MFGGVKNSLAIRLLRIVFSIYLAITCIITLAQMSNEYLLEKRGVRSNLENYHSIFSGGLTTALWNLDDVQVEALLEGVVRLNDVAGVRIVGPDGKALFAYGRTNSRAPSADERDDLIGMFHKRFPLVYDGYDIGSVYYYSSDALVFEKVKYNFLVILMNAVIKTAILWGLFLWAFQKFLGRALENFISKMEATDFDRMSSTPIRLNTLGTGELDRIQQVFNAMMNRLFTAKQSLESLNRELEERVADRTRKLEKLSVTDELTGLYNRRHFNSTFEKELRRARREKTSLSLIILDVDYFKPFNDTYGHAVGDETLRNVGQVLQRESRRPADYTFRVGGEEFAIVSSHHVPPGIMTFAEKIRLAVADMGIPHSASPVAGYVTVSLGVVTVVPGPDDTVDSLFRRADDALYQAKKEGRNRVIDVS